MRIDLKLLIAFGMSVSLTVSVAGAQTTTAPVGAVRGFFGGGGPPNPGRTTQQVSAWFDLGAGYDQDLEAAGAPPETSLDGFAGTVVGNFRYWRGRTTRSLEASARLFRNRQSAEQSTATGGEVNLSANWEMGRRAGASVQLRAANDSAILFGAFGPAFPEEPAVGAEITPPDVSPPQGVVENRWFAFGGSATAHRNWTPRQQTTVQFVQLRRRPLEGEGLDSNLLMGSVHQDWAFRPNTALRAAYRFERVQQEFGVTGTVFEAPVRLQTFEAGLRYQRPFSPIRSFNFAFAAGATHLFDVATALGDDAGGIEPIGSVTAGYTLTQRWLLSASAARSLTVLQGIAPDPFTNDVVTVSMTGVMSRRVTLIVSGAIARGRAVGTAPGSFDATGGTATIRYGFRYGGVFAAYSRYKHQLRQTFSPPGAIPHGFDQHSVRTGITIWLPLYGGF